MADDDDARIDKLVDMLVLADRIAERYIERKRELNEEPDFEPLGLVERLSLVQVLSSVDLKSEVAESKALRDRMSQVAKLVEAKMGGMRLALEDIYRSDTKDVGVLKAIAKNALTF